MKKKTWMRTGILSHKDLHNGFSTKPPNHGMLNIRHAHTYFRISIVMVDDDQGYHWSSN